MRQIILTNMVLFLVLNLLMGGVIRESKTKVKFKGFGEFASHETILLQDLKQHKESQNEFKAQGMMGQMISKLLFGEKQKGEIVDLEAMKIYELLHEKKRYRVRPIEKIKFEDEEMQGEMETNKAEAEEEYQETESNIKITRQVFKVVPTGKSKTINKFPAKEYHVFWITEWLNTETGEKGKDSLFTDVWTTKASKEFENAMKEEQNFQMKYLKSVGIGADIETNAILGLNWLQMFQAMSKSDKKMSKMMDSKFVQEMKKIEGIPVLVDGKYFATRSGKKSAMEQEDQPEVDITNPGGMFGGFLKKKLKEKTKKKPSKNEPDFSYHTELINLQTKSLDAKNFSVPDGYQLVE